LLKCSIIFVVMVYTPIFCKIIVSITFCFYASFNAVALLLICETVRTIEKYVKIAIKYYFYESPSMKITYLK